MKCIFCLNDKEPSDEHVIPDSIGGNIKIIEVCRVCNGKLNQRVDNPFSECDLIKFFRSVHNIGGKRGIVKQFFAGEVRESHSGKKMLLDDRLKPYYIPEVKIEKDSDGREIITLNCDISDRDNVENIIGLTLRKKLKIAHPELKAEQIDAIAKIVINNFRNEQPQAENIIVNKRICMNFDDLLSEFIKIAYEIWYRKFGYAWVETSTTAKTIRDTLSNNGPYERIHANLYCQAPYPIPFDNTSINHLIILTNGVCYVRIFNVSCTVTCEETNTKFMLNDDNAWVIINDFSTGKVIEKPLHG